jgi:hypothetical protein
MVKHAVRYMLLSALAVAAGCSSQRSGSIAAVTIEATCGSSADCPSGFECTADVEHGPPTALCESADAEATCPAGYEIKERFGQVFCKPPEPITTHGSRASRSADAVHRRRADL